MCGYKSVFAYFTIVFVVFGKRRKGSLRGFIEIGVDFDGAGIVRGKPERVEFVFCERKIVARFAFYRDNLFVYGGFLCGFVY